MDATETGTFNVAVVEGVGLLNRTTGELVDLTDVAQTSAVYQHVQAAEQELRRVKRALAQALADQARERGQRTIHFDGGKVVVGSDTAIEWRDVAGMKRELLEAGMPLERAWEIVTETVDYKVAAVEANRAAKANPVYAEIIDRHRVVVPKNPSITF